MTNVVRAGVQRFENGELSLAEEHLATEGLIHIAVNGDTVTTLLGSPEGVEELAIGHLMTEHGVLSDAISNVQAAVDQGMVSVSVDLSSEHTLKSRSTLVTSSCGACDQANLPDLIEATPTVECSSKDVDMDDVLAAVRTMRTQQPSFDKTGGVHAAGLFFGSDEPVLVREDIGRHNAVDKVIGAWAHASLRQPEALLLSGRCGWDIVSKAANAGIPIIASLGAASSLAAETARLCNMTLLSFVKGGKAVVIGPVDGRFKRKH